MNRHSKSALLACVALFAATSINAQQVTSSSAPSPDPRVGLKAGVSDAGTAAWNMALVAHRDRSAGFFNPKDLGDFGYINGDLAFDGHYAFQGGYHGLQIWDISNPAAPSIYVTIPCPGGQGDVSIYHHLLFQSVEETKARLDCGDQGVPDTVSKDRFRGVRIFDITDLKHPKVVAAVQTCRGSHTHTLVVDPKDKANVYVYVSGTGSVRSPSELAGCSGKRPNEDPNTSLFRIEVIKVPLAAPQKAAIVSMPRVFADSAGNIAGLFQGNESDSLHGQSETNMCHDITVYESIGLAAGACAGNGLLMDISNPANPKRVAQVSDPNFAYWHSATFSNSGKSVLFSDEWGGGVGPKCRATDRRDWGADAIFTVADRKMTFASYYKLPAVQTANENCVAHDGNLIPIPGRDIMAQAWYQGGISLFDFTDPSHPREVAFWDEGPLSDTSLVLGGYWSSYWYNGHIYASDLARGFEVFDLKAGPEITQNEIDAAKLVMFDHLNPQSQPKYTWPAKFVVARAYVDQLERGNGLPADRITSIRAALDHAEKLSGGARHSALKKLASSLDTDMKSSSDAPKVKMLEELVEEIK